MSEVENGKLCAILAWLFPIGLIWYFVDEKMKRNKFAEFHVKQSLVLAIVTIVLSIVVSVLSFIFGLIALIPIIGWIIGGVWLFVVIAIYVVIFILWLIGIIAAAQGKKKDLPIFGKFAEKLKF